LKILAVSDRIVEHIYSNSIQERYGDIDFVVSCGDLPNYYLEFIVSSLNKPLFYVMGNHCTGKIYTESGQKDALPEGCINLDNNIIEYKNVIIAGLEGSMKYSGEKHQYTDFQMNWKINRLKPQLYLNKLFKKRFVDILVTHAPPFHIHDGEDLCHRGFKGFFRFIETYQPKYLIHGHIHLYGTGRDRETLTGKTRVVNAFGFRVIEI